MSTRLSLWVKIDYLIIKIVLWSLVYCSYHLSPWHMNQPSFWGFQDFYRLLNDMWTSTSDFLEVEKHKDTARTPQQNYLQGYHKVSLRVSDSCDVIGWIRFFWTSLLQWCFSYLAVLKNTLLMKSGFATIYFCTS